MGLPITASCDTAWIRTKVFVVTPLALYQEMKAVSGNYLHNRFFGRLEDTGISPLMAAINGHVPAVKLLLDMGSDINTQIETKRNTAQTLACQRGALRQGCVRWLC
ncbi:unnamed protein product [Oncorhynchus mykiss]|uniref:Uncharacterized protein n=1 Tax=Oncorhynchus mykiss TaxID=8022 RepID=A0A060VQL1_ONCMY|nr:unnamed protein product [Oncorhynchus mykiss]